MLTAAYTRTPEAQPGRSARRGDRTPKQQWVYTPVLFPYIALPPAGWASPLPRRLNGLNQPSDPAAGYTATEHTRLDKSARLGWVKRLNGTGFGISKHHCLLMRFATPPATAKLRSNRL